MKRVNKFLLSVCTFAFAFGMFFGSHAFAKTAVEVQLNDQEPVQEGGQVHFDKPSKNVTTTEEKSDGVANKAIKDLTSGDEFTFHNEQWIVLNPEEGYAMMKKGVNELELKDAHFDENIPSKIVEYFDTNYKKKMSKDEQSLLKSTFGLVKFNEQLHVTVYFKPYLKLNKNGELVAPAKSQNVTNHQGMSKNTRNILIAGGVLFILLSVGLGMAVRNRKRQIEKREKTNA